MSLSGFILIQKTQSLMKETQDHLDKSKEYYEKIKKEIQSDNDNDVNQTFHNDASKSQSFEVSLSLFF
jgi:vacuolar-type H+-ATPase subunit H